MEISNTDTNRICDEREVYEQLLFFQDAEVLELGCGKADKTLAIAEGGKVKSIVALEVDEIQHAENLRRTVPGHVRFERGGAQAIPAADQSYDIVMMFKSLHHVPVDLMDAALREIHRVLENRRGSVHLRTRIFRGFQRNPETVS